VQLEKFRHSPNGRTDTPVEKFRQVVGASLKAYRAGKNTRAWRERIIVNYLNPFRWQLHEAAAIMDWGRSPRLVRHAALGGRRGAQRARHDDREGAGF
jgi:hypothetical protein